MVAVASALTLRRSVSAGEHFGGNFRGMWVAGPSPPWLALDARQRPRQYQDAHGTCCEDDAQPEIEIRWDDVHCHSSRVYSLQPDRAGGAGAIRHRTDGYKFSGDTIWSGCGGARLANGNSPIAATPRSAAATNRQERRSSLRARAVSSLARLSAAR